MILTITEDRQRRFWNNVVKGNRCWIWIKGKDKDGYGKVTMNKRHLRAHRVAWTLTNGTLPDGTFSFPEGLYVCHTCDNPPCVNPEHLFCGTNKDNTVDSVLKGRHSHGKTHHWFGRRVTGESNPSSKLKVVDVLAIRRLSSENGLSQRKIAKLFGVSQVLVGQIILRKNWTHV